MKRRVGAQPHPGISSLHSVFFFTYLILLVHGYMYMYIHIGPRGFTNTHTWSVLDAFTLQTNRHSSSSMYCKRRCYNFVTASRRPQCPN